MIKNIRIIKSDKSYGICPDCHGSGKDYSEDEWGMVYACSTCVKGEVYPVEKIIVECDFGSFEVSSINLEKFLKGKNAIQ